MKKRKILTIAAALLVTLNAGAFGFETVENAAEPVRTETDVNLSDTVDIPLVDEKYGDLIWYSNFDVSEDYSVPNYVKEETGAVLKPASLKSTAIVNDPTGSENKCLELVAGGNYSSMQIAAPAYTQPGTYTLVMDLYFPAETSEPRVLGRVEFKNVKDPWTPGRNDIWEEGWPGPVKETGKWITCIWTVKAGDENGGLVEFGARRMENTEIPYYYDNLRLYCNPTAGANQTVLLDGTSRQFITLENDTYTFPEPADKSDFVAWYCEESGERYAPGEAAKKTQLLGKTFVSFHQNANAPAMGFSYEGESTEYKGDSGKGITFVTDDNRSVMRLWQMPGSMWNSTDKYYQNDMRLFFIPRFLPSVNTFDPQEYNIVSYCYKISKAVNAVNKVAPDEITAADLEENTAPWFAVNYSPSDTYGGFFNPGGEHKIGRGNHTATIGEYQVFTADMALESNSVPGCKWNDYDSMAGFVVQPNASGYEGITYIDYLRVYRDGITTVTYNTNASEYEDMGYTVQHEVAAETGRGLGTGYLLTGDKPQVEEITFVGWALTPDATPADVVTSIDLTGDTTLYAVWTTESDVAPRTVNKNQLSTGAVSGIRFAAIMDLGVKSGLSASFKGVEPDEYGFIVSRKSLLDGEELTFGTKPNEKGVGQTPNGITYVSGAAYNRAKGINYVYDNDGSKLSEVTEGKNEAFTAVLWNIPETHYAETLVARPYINIGGLYFYGSAREMSMKSVALSLKENYDSLTDAEKELVDKILSVTGE